MNDRRARHGSSSSIEWGSQPSRTQQITEIVDEELLLDTPLAQPKPAPRRKDKDLCKQNHWQPHGYELRVRQYGWSRRKTCGWIITWNRETREHGIGWHCGHEAYCPHCGKTLDRRPRECPDWEPLTEAEKTCLEREIAERAGKRPVYRQQRKIITGPSRYRKKKNTT